MRGVSRIFPSDDFANERPLVRNTAFEAAVTDCDYLVGYNGWTLGRIGGWDDACIDSAMAAFCAWQRTNPP